MDRQPDLNASFDRIAGACESWFPPLPEKSLSSEPEARNAQAALDGLFEFSRQWYCFWFAWCESLTNAAMGVMPSENDKRFSAEAWRDDPRFYALRSSYLSFSDYLFRTVELVPADDKTRGQLRFVTRQIVDAMSPANFLATNPEAMRLAMETRGESLIKGAELFMRDAAKGRVSMSDEEAFKVGKDIAVTPGDVIYENELIQLIQYRPLTEKTAQRPLLIVPPCINKFYILDLQPGNSFVRHAVEQGNTVFMISWRNITPRLGHLTWDDYLRLGVMQAIDVVSEIAGADRINALGFCIGGAMLASCAAILRRHGDDRLASITLLTTMLDYGDAGEIGYLVTEASVAASERSIGKGGVMPGKEMALAFASLRANDLIWPYVVNSYLKGKSPAAFDLLYWNADATNLPGPMFTWYVRNTYLENRLRAPGGTVQLGEPVDLSEIDIPAYVYASREDHLVPWRTCYESVRLLGGENVFVLGASGHIAGVINPPAKRRRNYWVNDATPDEAQTWLADAQSEAGSWWPHWSAWLKRHRGKLASAPKHPGSRRYRPVEHAPGRYVKARAEAP